MKRNKVDETVQEELHPNPEAAECGDCEQEVPADDVATPTEAPTEASAEATPAEPPKALTAEEKLAQANEQIAELQAENKKLNKTINRLQSSADKSDTYLNQLVAMKNDFESYKRRMRFNAEQARQEGVQGVALKLIEIADTFELAQKHLTDEETLKAFEMVHQQFVQTLHGLGIVEMDVKGKDFDHMTMNALSQLDYGEENKGKVVEVYKTGYIMDERVLRYAEVIVGA